MTKRLNREYVIYRHVQSSVAPSARHADGDGWDELNEKGEVAIVLLRGNDS